MGTVFKKGQKMRKNMCFLLILLLATLIVPESMTTNTANSANPVITEQKKAFTLDKSGNSHIVWMDFAGNDPCMMYVRWSSLGWVNCKGEQYPENNAQTCIRISNSFTLMNPSIDIDSKGNPSISMIIGDGNLFFMHFSRWDGKGWVDVKGRPFDLISSRINDGLKCAHHPTLKLDSNDMPQIVWSQYESDTPDISYIRWDGKGWVNAWGKPYPINAPTICKSEKSSKQPSMAIDSNDNPHIAWTESEQMGFSRIQYARWNGEKWVNYKGTLFSSTGFEVSHPSNSSYTPSLVLDKKDAPHIAFVSHSKGNIGICYIRLENKKWVNTLGKPYPKNSAFIAEREYLDYRHYFQNPWLDLRDNGMPNVVWEGEGIENTKTIYYLCQENSKWRNCAGEEYPCSADISRDCVNSNLPIIRICPKGKPNVVWMGHKTDNVSSVCYIRWDENCWVNAYGQPYPRNSGSIEE